METKLTKKIPNLKGEKMITNNAINLLGQKARDKISCATGYITSVCFDLYGCIQVIINPCKMGEDGKMLDTYGWIDINRIIIINKNKIMKNPDFDEKYTSFKSVSGPSEKPLK
jgi:hypothetical protein